MELLALWSTTPPEVLGADAPPREFSGERAKRVLRRLFPASIPHAAGTPQEREMRDRVIAELARIDLESSIQTGVVCGKYGLCAEVENIVAIVPGRTPRLETGLVAHYDSVPPGPGVSDDGQGVAILLETARALAAEPPKQSVLLLFTDGEELGLLGARLFAREHPLAKSLEVVINVEARGTRGPSLMFETTKGSAWLVERFARSAPHPLTSSFFASVYRQLPNDTDLTPLAAAGCQGLNLAFIGGVEHYHTALDDLKHLDLRSVQHQGATVLALARDLGEAGSEPAGDDTVFFDVLSLWVFRLKTFFMLPLAALCTLLLGLSLFRDWRRRGFVKREWWRGGLALVVSLVLAAADAALVSWLLRAAGGLPSPWVATPAPLLTALFACALSGIAAALTLCKTAASRLAYWDSVWLSWLILGWVLVVVLPAASYVVLVPALTAAIVRDRVCASEGFGRVGYQCLPAVVAGALWLPSVSMLYDVIGFAAPVALAATFSLTLLPWAPLLHALLGGAWVAASAALAALGLVGVQAVLPTYSTEVPQRLNLGLVVDAEGRSRWLADTTFGPLPAQLRAARAWSDADADPHPLPSVGGHFRQARAERTTLPPPEVSVEVPSPGLVRLQAVLPKEVWALGVYVPSAMPQVRAVWRGQVAEPRKERRFRTFDLVPGDDRRIIIDLSISEEALRQLEVSHIALGLVTHESKVPEGRGERALPHQFGDMTVVSTKLR